MRGSFLCYGMRARFSDESWQERRDVALKRGLWRFCGISRRCVLV